MRSRCAYDPTFSADANASGIFRVDQAWVDGFGVIRVQPHIVSVVIKAVAAHDG
jgi:hypothetical protein